MPGISCLPYGYTPQEIADYQRDCPTVLAAERYLGSRHAKPEITDDGYGNIHLRLDLDLAAESDRLDDLDHHLRWQIVQLAVNVARETASVSEAMFYMNEFASVVRQLEAGER